MLRTDYVLRYTPDERFSALELLSFFDSGLTEILSLSDIVDE